MGNSFLLGVALCLHPLLYTGAWGQFTGPETPQPANATETIPASESSPMGDPPYVPTAVPLDPGTIFERVTVGRERGQVAGKGERLIYSNTLGDFQIHFPTNQPISDDIAITAANGCNLTRYRFKVLGNVVPTGASGPYTVTYGLYSNCPLAHSISQRELVRIPGTDGILTFDDDAPREIEHIVNPENTVTLPTNFYLSLRFDRANCGTVVGTPAMVGFSADVWDFPGFPCNGFLGGFPQFPHASYWAEFYGDETCKEAHLGYKSARASGGTVTLGSNMEGVDDVRLLGNACNMVSYEVTVRGAGLYTFDLREDCEGTVIPGTPQTFMINQDAIPTLQVARFDFDPPIPIPDSLWVSYRVSTNSSGAILAGIEPVVGESGTDHFVNGIAGCVPFLPTQGAHGAINLSIICDGASPVGACCDAHVRDEHDEAVCRQLPQINCSRCGSASSNPIWCPWMEGAECDPDPFPHACGLSACCKPDDTCENLTRNQCDAALPLDRPREWHFGEFCEDKGHQCEYTACLAGEGDCTAVHEGTGCDNFNCCRDVCDHDDFCCTVEWDQACLRWADSFCSIVSDNDQCAPGHPIDGLDGATELAVPGVTYGTNRRASTVSTEPRFCCHGGTGTCDGGLNHGDPCLTDEQCGGFGGVCNGLAPAPDSPGYGTVWHKFVATHTTTRISTCGSLAWDERSSDSLLQVYAAQVPVDPIGACSSLAVIGCNDDAGPECPTEPHNSSICIAGLTPGQTYYVLFASKLPQFQGLYRITASAPCTPEPTKPGDSCFDPLVANDGTTPFDTAGATFECPAESCSPEAGNDVWYQYTATCTGNAAFSTCGEDDPDTNIAVYDCQSCPAFSDNESSLGCIRNRDTTDCIQSAHLELPVALGQCFRVRIADTLGFPVSGELTITCASDDCQPNGIPDDQDIASCAKDLTCKDCNINGVPDGCDIRDDPELDLNLNGKIDTCEPCPSGFISLIAPPGNFVDARRPLDPATQELEGTTEAQVAGMGGAEASCWSLCETSINSGMHPPYDPNIAENAIVAVSEDPPGQYLLKLKRPITPGEATFVRYTDDDGNVSSVRLMAHPANIDGNAQTNPTDILALIDVLNGIKVAPWGQLSTDCDHSGATAPADLICVIDLLNAGWNETRKPSATYCP